MQINAHRHRQRTPQAAALLQQAAGILAMPEIKKKMTVEKNPNLIEYVLQKLVGDKC